VLCQVLATLCIWWKSAVECAHVSLYRLADGVRRPSTHGCRALSSRPHRRPTTLTVIGIKSVLVGFQQINRATSLESGQCKPVLPRLIPAKKFHIDSLSPLKLEHSGYSASSCTQLLKLTTNHAAAAAQRLTRLLRQPPLPIASARPHRSATVKSTSATQAARAPRTANLHQPARPVCNRRRHRYYHTLSHCHQACCRLPRTSPA
jgi:hypothetical protein